MDELNDWGIALQDIRCFLKVPYEGFGFTNINILVNGRELGTLGMEEHQQLADLMRRLVSDLIGEEACGRHLKHIVFGPTTCDLHAQRFYPILELPQRFPQFKQEMAVYAGF